MLNVEDLRCGDCKHLDPNRFVDSRSTRFLMKIYECKKTAQYVSIKRVICKEFDPKTDNVDGSSGD